MSVVQVSGTTPSTMWPRSRSQPTFVPTSKSELNSGCRPKMEVGQGALTPHLRAKHLYMWVGEEGRAELTLYLFKAAPWAWLGETP